MKATIAHGEEIDSAELAQLVEFIKTLPETSELKKTLDLEVLVWTKKRPVIIYYGEDLK